MGLLQQAIETYDAMKDRAGVETAGQETLAPVSHLATRAQIEITIDADGHFVQARPADDQKIIIPVTEDSAGRTVAPAAHPLCDQLGYLLPDDQKKHTLYVDQLSDWVASRFTHPKAAAVLKYIQGGTLRSDLEKADLLKLDNGKLKNEKDLVRWIVVGLGESSGPVWTDVSLMNAFIGYYQQERQSEAPQEKEQTTLLPEGQSKDIGLCMLTGERVLPAAQHPKGVVPMHGNAKIISANDSANFTYRGRFADPAEAATIGYEASQKAHNALKWVVANQGKGFGSRMFICWNPHGIETPRPYNPLCPKQEEPLKPALYNDALHKIVMGYRQTLPDSEGVIVAVFDAANTGRLAVTYYNELRGSDFIDRLAYWDETCCWYDSGRGTSAPLLYNIVNFAFGTQRAVKVETDDRIISQHMQRLVACRVDKSAFPEDIMRALVTKAENLQVYSKENRRALLFTACAAIRKYKIDRYKEELAMALEPERKDRSYQFGRLLAVMEKIETDTYDSSEGREPNAIRLQSVFVRRPGYIARIVMEQLKSAYYPRLRVGQRIFYDRLIGEIMDKISECGEADYNKPLTETYLPGYYLQKNALYARKDQSEKTNDMEDENHDA